MVQGKWTIYHVVSEFGGTHQDTISELISKMPERSILFTHNSGPDNHINIVPPNEQYGVLSIWKLGDLRVELHFMDYTGQRIYEAFYNALEVTPAFSGWNQIAIAKPPKKHDFIPLNGLEIGYPSTYKINQFNELTIQIAFIKPANIPLSNGLVVACLPESHRTTAHAVVQGLCGIADALYPVYFTVSGDGGIRIYSPPDTNGKTAVLYATQHI